MATNIRDVLRQLADLRKEEKEKKEAIERLQMYINKLEESGYKERDSVTGGNGGKQHFVIEGYPYPLYTTKLNQLLSRKLKLQNIHSDIEDQIAIAEAYINEQEESKIRRLLTYRYIDDLSWIKVAQKMGGKYTADGCRIIVERFLKKN